MKAINNYCRFAVLSGLILFATACQKGSLYQGPKPEPEISQDLKDFSFATRGDVRLSVNYNAPGFKTFIEVYGENPMLEDGKTKKADLNPVFAAYTDDNGKLDINMYIPTAVEEAYLYTNRWGLPLCVKLDVTKGGMSYDATKVATKANSVATRADYDYVFGTKAPYSLKNNQDGLMTLGKFDVNGRLAAGHITQTNTIKGEQIADLSERSQAYYNKYNGNKAELLKPADVTNVKMKTAGTLDLVFLTERAAYQNVFGYYYYKIGAAPRESDFKSMRKYVALPRVELTSPTSLATGNTVRLKYFGEDGNSEATDQFPAGTVIGWFVVSDGWKDDYIARYDIVPFRNYFFSDDVENNMRFVSLVDAKTGTVVLGCEDQPEKSFDREKEDYSDILFFVKSDDGELDNEEKPVIPDPNPNPGEDNETFKMEGVLAFEDIWPTGGDYDMNDVAVKYLRLFTLNKVNQVISIDETFTFIQRAGAADFESYFAYQMENAGDIQGKGHEVETETNSIIWPIDTRKASETSFTVIRRLTNTIDLEKAQKDFNPYIIVGARGDLRKEVHLPSMKATSKADQSFIGTADDAYYMNKDGYFPFAIDISKATFVLSPEKVTIDKTYPRFTIWATSFGKQAKDWYEDAPKGN